MARRIKKTLLTLMILSSLLAGFVWSAQLSETEITDPSWGFKFKTPKDWLYEKSSDGAVVGHNNVPGRILIFPHQGASLQQVQMNMTSGLSEEEIQLHLTSKLESISKTTLAGNYSGSYQGQPVKARGIGTFSPFGGGAYVIALALPNEYGPKLTDAAENIAKGMQYFKVDMSNLISQLAGTWKDIRSSGNTIITLQPNGIFSYYTDFSAGGDFTDDATGDATGSYSYGSSDNMQGRWNAQGTPQQGVITYHSQDGTQGTLDYQVHIENGRTYWNEYYFDGTLYSRKK